MAAIDTHLRTMLEKGGSDLHLTVGLPPVPRVTTEGFVAAPDPRA